MPYIGNIVQDFSVSTAMLNTDSVTSIKIDDGTIVNADINASAAIDVSKLSGVLPLAGGTLTGNLTISNTEPKLFLTDTNNNDDFSIQNQNGYFAVKDESDGQNRLVIHPDGTAVIGGNLDVGAGLDVEGAVTFNDSGANVDFRVEGDADANLLFIDASHDRVGIGATLPEFKLDINGEIASKNASKEFISLNLTNNEARIRSSFYSGASGAYRPITFFTSDNERMRIDTSGRLLIGHTAVTPVDNDANNPHFQVQGTGGDDSRISIRHNSTTASNAASIYLSRSKGTSNSSKTSVASGDALGNLIFMGADGTHDTRAAIIQASCDGTPGDNDMPGRLEFFTTPDGGLNSAERMRIDSSGRVGIATTSPAEKLDVAGSIRANTGTDIAMDSNAAGQIRFRGNGYTGAIALDGTAMRVYHNSASRNLILGCNETAMMTINTSGNVGIGTNAPDVKLDIARLGSAWTGQDPVAGTAAHFHNGNNATTSPSYLGLGAGSSSISGINFGDEDDADVGRIYYSHSDNSLRFGTNGASERMRVGSDGKVGIGTTSPGAELHVEAATPEIRIKSTNASVSQGTEIGRLAIHTNDPTTPSGVGEVFRITSYSAQGNGADYGTKLINRAGSNSGESTISLGQGAVGAITFSTNTSGSGLERLRIDGSGRSLFSGTLGYANIPLSGNPANAAIQIRTTSKYNGIAFGEGAVSGAIGLGGDDTTTAMVFVANAHPANLGGGTKDIFEWHAGTAGGGGPGKYMTLDTSGHLALSQGNLEFASGSGIDFSAVSDGSRTVTSDGNKFDDYEEGSWAPALSFSGTNNAASFDIQQGVYRKIGSMVFVAYALRSTNFNGSSGAVRISGLPFSSTNTPVSNIATNGVFPIKGVSFTGEFISQQLSGTLIELYGVSKSTSNNVYSSIGVSEMNQTGEMFIKGQICYNVA